jgi:hypothetical protein
VVPHFERLVRHQSRLGQGVRVQQDSIIHAVQVLKRAVLDITNHRVRLPPALNPKLTRPAIALLEYAQIASRVDIESTVYPGVYGVLQLRLFFIVHLTHDEASVQSVGYRISRGARTGMLRIFSLGPNFHDCATYRHWKLVGGQQSPTVIAGGDVTRGDDDGDHGDDDDVDDDVDEHVF